MEKSDPLPWLREFLRTTWRFNMAEGAVDEFARQLSERVQAELSRERAAALAPVEALLVEYEKRTGWATARDLLNDFRALSTLPQEAAATPTQGAALDYLTRGPITHAPASEPLTPAAVREIAREELRPLLDDARERIEETIENMLAQQGAFNNRLCELEPRYSTLDARIAALESPAQEARKND